MKVNFHGEQRYKLCQYEFARYRNAKNDLYFEPD
jgi:hypothetical protein